MLSRSSRGNPARPRPLRICFAPIYQVGLGEHATAAPDEQKAKVILLRPDEALTVASQQPLRRIQPVRPKFK